MNKLTPVFVTVLAFFVSLSSYAIDKINGLPDLENENYVVSDSKTSVFIIGGRDFSRKNPPSSGAIYEFNLYPAVGATIVGNLNFPRTLSSSALLSDGRILIVGGCDANRSSGLTCFNKVGESDTEIFDPTTGNVKISTPSGFARVGHEMIKLANGRILVGASNSESVMRYVNSVWNSSELRFLINKSKFSQEFDPITERWLNSTSMLNQTDDYQFLKAHDQTVYLINRCALHKYDESGSTPLWKEIHHFAEDPKASIEYCGASVSADHKKLFVLKFTMGKKNLSLIEFDWTSRAVYKKVLPDFPYPHLIGDFWALGTSSLVLKSETNNNKILFQQDGCGGSPLGLDTLKGTWIVSTKSSLFGCPGGRIFPAKPALIDVGLGSFLYTQRDYAVLFSEHDF